MNTREIIHNFIVFEGIDGAGKSTQIHNIAQLKRFQEIPTHFTFEPNKGIIGQFIRQLFSTHQLSNNNEINSALLSYLFAADRHEHIFGEDGVLEHTQKNELVICDRYLFSSIAYQHNNSFPQLSRELNQNFPLPALVFYFDIDPEMAIKRMQSKNKDSMEKLEILIQVHLQYKNTLDEYAKLFPQMQILPIDATLPSDTLTKEISEKILAHISEK